MQQIERQAGSPGLRVAHGARRARLVAREARREANRAEAGLVPELRCECSEPDCRSTVPAAAENARRVPERFLVVPAHLGLDFVIAAADGFFVVEARGVAMGMM